jgi:hypothetical protein
MRPLYWLGAAACAIALPVVAACSSDPSTLGGNEFGVNHHPTGGGPVPTTTTTSQGPNPTPQPSAMNPNPAPSGSVVPPPGVTTPDAKTFFIMSVYPSLEGTCGGCHNGAGTNGAPGYLGTDANTAYTAVEGRGYIAQTSMLLQKGQHEGPALSSQQVTLINQWIQMEIMARGNNTPTNMFAKLGNCIDPTLFDAVGLKNLRTTPRTNENPDRCTGCNNEPCQVCHESGEYGMHSNFGQLGTQTITALQGNGTAPQGMYLIEKYITTNGTTLAPSTAIMDKSTATQAGPAYSHPMFTVSATMQTAIQAFANDIITKYNNKTCGQ